MDPAQGHRTARRGVRTARAAARRPHGRTAPTAQADQRAEQRRPDRHGTALDGGGLMQTESTTLDLKVGDVVEVRSEAEILATLDENGALDSMPFMPEMLRYSGRRLTVGKVAHKACDTLSRGGVRKMASAVHLAEVRCGGEEHGACQAACLI